MHVACRFFWCPGQNATWLLPPCNFAYLHFTGHLLRPLLPRQLIPARLRPGRTRVFWKGVQQWYLCPEKYSAASVLAALKTAGYHTPATDSTVTFEHVSEKQGVQHESEQEQASTKD